MDAKYQTPAKAVEKAQEAILARIERAIECGDLLMATHPEVATAAVAATLSYLQSDEAIDRLIQVRPFEDSHILTLKEGVADWLQTLGLDDDA